MKSPRWRVSFTADQEARWDDENILDRLFEADQSDRIHLDAKIELVAALAQIRVNDAIDALRGKKILARQLDDHGVRELCADAVAWINEIRPVDGLKGTTDKLFFTCKQIAHEGA